MQSGAGARPFFDSEGTSRWPQTRLSLAVAAPQVSNELWIHFSIIPGSKMTGSEVVGRLIRR